MDLGTSKSFSLLVSGVCTSIYTFGMQNEGDKLEKLMQLSVDRCENCESLSFPEKICGNKKIMYSNMRFIVKR